MSSWLSKEEFDKKLSNNQKCLCGHTISGLSKKGYVICSWCGKRIYRSDIDKFKGELGKVMKKRFI